MSIWGEPFEDEIHDDLKHNGRGVLSMVKGSKHLTFFISKITRIQLNSFILNYFVPSILAEIRSNKKVSINSHAVELT